MRPLFLRFSSLADPSRRFDKVRAQNVLLICLTLLTALVVLSVCRIEYLNAIGGHVLPRQEMASGQSANWEIAELNVVLGRLDDQFFERREIAVGIDAFENGATEPSAPKYGAPYSAAEQRSIASVTRQHEVLTKLHWSLRNLGWPQYILAPTALLLAVICGLGWKGIGTRVFASVCSSLCCMAFFLVLVRGYWQAL